MLRLSSKSWSWALPDGSWLPVSFTQNCASSFPGARQGQLPAGHGQSVYSLQRMTGCLLYTLQVNLLALSYISEMAARRSMTHALPDRKWAPEVLRAKFLARSFRSKVLRPILRAELRARSGASLLLVQGEDTLEKHRGRYVPKHEKRAKLCNYLFPGLEKSTEISAHSRGAIW